MTRLRLLKLVVQPTFALDDDQSLAEVQAQPIVVPAKDWPGWATGGYIEAFAALEAELGCDSTTNTPHTPDNPNTRPGD